MTDIQRRVEVTVSREATAPTTKRLLMSLFPLDMPTTRAGDAGVGSSGFLLPFRMRAGIAKAGSPIAVHTEQRVLIFRISMLFQKTIDRPTRSPNGSAMGSTVSLNMFNGQKSRIGFSTAGTAITIGGMSFIAQLSVRILKSHIKPFSILFSPSFCPCFTLWAVVQGASFFWILFPPTSSSFICFLWICSSISAVFCVDALFTPRAQSVFTATILIEKIQGGWKRQLALCTSFHLGIFYFGGALIVNICTTVGPPDKLAHAFGRRGSSLLQQHCCAGSMRTLKQGRQERKRVRFALCRKQLQFVAEMNCLHIMSVARKIPRLKSADNVSAGQSAQNGEPRLRFGSPIVGGTSR